MTEYSFANFRVTGPGLCDEIKILSKINLNNSLKLDNKKYSGINLQNEREVEKLILDLKNSYEAIGRQYPPHITEGSPEVQLPYMLEKLKPMRRRGGNRSCLIVFLGIAGATPRVC